MIVDDETNITAILKKSSENHGFRVVSHNNPLTALSAFKKDFYDLVLDMKMPQMDGFELYQNIQKVNNIVQVCCMTAFEVYYDALKELFPDSYSTICFIKKPSAMEDFVKKLNNEMRHE